MHQAKKKARARGADTPGKYVGQVFITREKPAAYAGHSIFVFAAQADWMTTACILAGNPL